MTRRVLVEKLPVAPAADDVMSLSPEHALREHISTETVRRCTEAYGEALTAIILTGSLARDEATFVREGSKWQVLGDAEFLLVFQSRAKLPAAASVREVSESIQDALAAQDLTCKTTLGTVGPDYLRKMEPSIFGYELKVCGRVVWGRQDVLSLIPPFSPNDIPLEDAWQMLCNRMIELLEVVLESNPCEPPSAELHYRTAKLYLDMATSFLVFVERYVPTYRGRAAKLSTFAEAAADFESAPIPLREFSRYVTACTHWKLGSAEAGPPQTWDFWRLAVSHAERLWRWETACLTDVPPDSELSHLWQRRMSLQPAIQRLRGWFYLVREGGWRRSRSRWTSWFRRAWTASPRYWTYSAATQIVFLLPDLVSQDGAKELQNGESLDFEAWLPYARRKTEQSSPSWKPLAADIVRHYQDFLVGTRS